MLTPTAVNTADSPRRRQSRGAAACYHRMSKHRSLDDTRVHAVQTGWTDILMICRKCSRKLDGGFGPDGRDTLKRAVRAQCREARVGVIEVACLGVCPKRAVTTLRASRPGVMSIVVAGRKEETLLF